jgi:bifunctional non-homologous end joining protein LigD
VKIVVQVEDRQLTLTNLDKLLYPDGFTKGQVLDYYTRIAPVLLPHLAGRPLTLKRWPNGVQGHSFYEKNAPSHRPDWLRTETLPSPGSTKQRETIEYAVVEELAALVWVANLATLELHTPMWRVGSAPDLLVFDLDPGPGASIVQCCEVALLLRPLLEAEGLAPLAKTSGSKGLQVYARTHVEDSSTYAKGLAQRLERDRPALVVHRMAKALRPGRVLVDWSQNNPAKTTVCVYSLRARDRPTVSTPVTWDEVEKCSAAVDLVFTSDDVLGRVEAQGDLFAPLVSS